ncbi:MAG: hypothetical protein ACKV0T_02825 [Planctomycetales bacterium]
MDQISQLCQQVSEEITHRSIRSTFPEVVDYRPSSAIPASQLTPPGTIGVFVSRKGSSRLKEVREAARSTKGVRDRKLVRQLFRQFRKKAPLTPTEAARRMVSEPVLAHLHYAGATMARYLYAESEEDLYVTVLPYAGGPLVERGFRLDEFFYEDDDEPLECVLIRNSPILNAAEVAALKKLPPELAHAYVSPLDEHANTMLLAGLGAHALVWGFVYGTYTWVKAHWDESLEHINPQALDSLGPAAAVRALLRLRIDILRESFGQPPSVVEQSSQV